MKEQWDKRYKSEEFIYGLEPNSFLKSYLLKNKPEKALFPGDGEGRNAIYAAKLGWDVTAFDYSETAKEKASKLASKNKVNIKYYCTDVESFHSDTKFDLVSIIFLHLSEKTRKSFHEKIQNLLNDNGVLLMECFSKQQIDNNSGGPKSVDLLYSIDELKSDFKNLNIELIETVETVLNEGPLHQGIANTIRIIARKTNF